MILIRKNISSLSIIIYKIINKFFAVIEHTRWKVKYQSCVDRFEFMGKGVIIDYNVLFLGPENISIGDNTFIGRNTIINASRGGKIKIGKGCGIAAGATMITWNADFMHHKNLNRKKNKSKVKDITIGDGVGLGYSVTINPGVVIGNGCEVAAGSVVMENVNDFEIVGGYPAKVISRRKETEKI